MISVAINILVGDRGKFLAILAGVAFSAFLTMVAASYFAGFLQRSYALVAEHPNGIWITDPRTQSSEQVVNMPLSAFYRARSVKGVGNAERMVLGTIDAKFPDGHVQSFQVIGLDDASLTGAPDLEGNSAHAVLRMPDSAIADLGGSKYKLDTRDRDGNIRQLQSKDILEANDNRIVVGGVSHSLPRFPPRPLLYMSMANALRVLPPERLSTSFIIAHPQAGIDSDELAANIERQTGLQALTAQSFSAKTASWLYQTSEDVTDMATMLWISVIIGFGFTAVMFYIFIAAHLRDFATLKALGTSHRTLWHMVMAQTLSCALIGTGIGVGTASAMKIIMAALELPFRIVWYGPTGALALNLVAAGAAAVIGLRPVQTLNPAQVFAAA